MSDSLPTAVLKVRDMLAFADDWKGDFYSECGGLRHEAKINPAVLDEPAYRYPSQDRIVFTTVEGDLDGGFGSSFIAILRDA